MSEFNDYLKLEQENLKLKDQAREYIDMCEELSSKNAQLFREAGEMHAELSGAKQRISELESETKTQRVALTRAVSLPKGELPSDEQYYTIMINGNCKAVRR